MTSPDEVAQALSGRILAAPCAGRRRLVALAGAPASGKSTLARVLADQLSQAGCATSVVPMDGFHLDNRILSDLGLLHRKGAPETFDTDGVLRLVRALAHADRVFYPTFDRDEDFSRAGSGQIDTDCACVVVEGNYLLYDAPIWRELQARWDLSIRLEVGSETLKRRLVRRWIDFGLPLDQAERRAMANDMVNATLIADHALPATITIQEPVSASDLALR